MHGVGHLGVGAGVLDLIGQLFIESRQGLRVAGGHHGDRIVAAAGHVGQNFRQRRLVRLVIAEAAVGQVKTDGVEVAVDPVIEIGSVDVGVSSNVLCPIGRGVRLTIRFTCAVREIIPIAAAITIVFIVMRGGAVRHEHDVGLTAAFGVVPVRSLQFLHRLLRLIERVVIVGIAAVLSVNQYSTGFICDFQRIISFRFIRIFRRAGQRGPAERGLCLGRFRHIGEHRHDRVDTIAILRAFSVIRVISGKGHEGQRVVGSSAGIFLQQDVGKLCRRGHGVIQFGGLAVSGKLCRIICSSRVLQGPGHGVGDVHHQDHVHAALFGDTGHAELNAGHAGVRKVVRAGRFVQPDSTGSGIGRTFVRVRLLQSDIRMVRIKRRLCLHRHRDADWVDFNVFPVNACQRRGDGDRARADGGDGAAAVDRCHTDIAGGIGHLKAVRQFITAYIAHPGVQHIGISLGQLNLLGRDVKPNRVARDRG